MTCPGGCINGGGQPFAHDADAIRARMLALYALDESAPVRTSHSNASVRRLYSEFLGMPLSSTSHRLLHTHYERRALTL
jgi:iron only hydrogenase large subunit-like protein